MNAIEQVVAPLKNDAMEHAAQYARSYIDRILADLEKNNWDACIVAPFPSATEGRKAYMEKKAKYSTYRMLTKPADEKATYWQNTKIDIRARCDESEARFIEEARTLAAEQYDAFVAKLVAKVGAVESATLEGSHVWGHSILTVTKADGSVERWKTQTIVNVSSLGKVFNQWPTRKVKA